jgi:hypothetical protein
MARIETTRSIRAPREEVFGTTANIEGLAEVVTDITAVEFLTGQREGVGTRFRSTRTTGRRTATVELQVTEYQRPIKVRMVTDRRGTTWDSTYTYLNTRDGTDVHLQLDVRPNTFLARLTSRFVQGSVLRSAEGDLDTVKAHLEGS